LTLDVCHTTRYTLTTTFYDTLLVTLGHTFTYTDGASLHTTAYTLTPTHTPDDLYTHPSFHTPWDGLHDGATTNDGYTDYTDLGLC